jgi:F-type H+-transporting ATPase subunit a
MLNISLAAETIVKVGFLPITNSLLMTWLVMGFLAIVSWYITSRLKKKPDLLQTTAELIIGGLHDFFSTLLGKHIDLLFPLVASIFLFIIFSNWMGLLPGVSTIGIWKQEEVIHVTEEITKEGVVEHTTVTDDSKTTISETQTENEKSSPVHAAETKNEEPKSVFIPLLRAPTADLNMTLALGLIGFAAIQYYGFLLVGVSYGKKFINLSNPIFFFVGILEIISDISKIISFTFRLFGNIFAGEVLLAVMAYLFPFFLPIPFYALELFVGFIQALVFAMLVSVFVGIAVSHGNEHHEAAAGTK